MSEKAREFALGAKLYYECGLSADSDIGRLPGFEIHAPFPVMTMIAHSIELALKSFLLSKGCEDVKSFGHYLVEAKGACMKVDQEGNPELASIDDHVLEIISDLHQNMVLRYGEPSELGRLPVFGPLQTLASVCLQLCNAPTRQEIWG